MVLCLGMTLQTTWPPASLLRIYHVFRYDFAVYRGVSITVLQIVFGILSLFITDLTLLCRKMDSFCFFRPGELHKVVQHGLSMETRVLLYNKLTF